jgi:isoquinoline 1-oxidoreductase beta subunit
VTDDLRGDFYRPASAHRLEGFSSGKGELLALAHRMAAPSVARRRAPEMLVAVPITSWPRAATTCSTRCRTCCVDYHEVDLGVPVGLLALRRRIPTTASWSRGFIRRAGGRRRGAIRLSSASRCSRKDPRMQRVIRSAASAAGWGRKPAAGTGLGIAAMMSYGTRVAPGRRGRSSMAGRLVVSAASGVPSIAAAWCIPGIVEQQMQGGIVFGSDGGDVRRNHFRRRAAVKQSNFHDYPLLADGGDAAHPGAHHSERRAADAASASRPPR